MKACRTTNIFSRSLTHTDGAIGDQSFEFLLNNFARLTNIISEECPTLALFKSVFRLHLLYIVFKLCVVFKSRVRAFAVCLKLRVKGGMLKSVQSGLSDLKRPLNVYSPSAIIGLSLLNSILMARFLKQSFAQTCLKETDNGKLQQFNYSRSLMTNRGTVERGLAALQRIIMHY